MSLSSIEESKINKVSLFSTLTIPKKNNDSYEEDEEFFQNSNDDHCDQNCHSKIHTE